MTQKKFNPRTILLVGFMIAVAALRMVLNPKWGFTFLSDFTPVGAMALFGGAYFSSKKAFLFPLLTLWLSDVFLGRFVFGHEWHLLYHGFYWVYGAFALMVVTGKFVMKNISITNGLVAALVVTLIHWIVTDTGVWLASARYPATLAGFWECLAAAIPFEGNFLSGTLLYGVVMFGSFEWMRSKYSSLSIA